MLATIYSNRLGATKSIHQIHSQSIKDELSRHVPLIHIVMIISQIWWLRRERALGDQAGLTSIANEVVVLVMVEGAESTSACGLRRPARRRCRGWRRRICASTVFRLFGKMYVRTPVIVSLSPSSHRERWSWRRAGLRRGESGEGERGEWRQRWGECGRCGSI
jgi:hypothetical protein